ncbi:MAG TPA: MFS transporter [Gemmatimonadaceae bacterium]|nr:MFS transporter [Gemmatimonadaceae bacterium]
MTATRLILINALIRIASATSGQLFAFLVADRIGSRGGVGALVVGLLSVSFYVTEMVGAPVAGRLADSRGQLRVLRWGPVFGVAAVLTGTVAALAGLPVRALLAVLVAARLSEGASAALAVPTTLALLARLTHGHASRRLRIMGLFEATSLAGLILGYLIGGVGWDALGGWAFLLLPAVYGAAWTLAHEDVPPERPAPTVAVQAWQTVRELARTAGTRSFVVAWLAVNAVVGVWVQQAPYLLKLPARSTSQSLVGGHSGREIGVIFAVWGITFLVGIALWSTFAPRAPRRRTLAIALLGMLMVVGSLALVNHGTSHAMLAVTVLGVLVESGFTPAAFAHMADLTDTRGSSRGMTMGVYSLLLGAGQLAGAGLGAPLAARWQMDGVLACTAVLALISLAGVARMRVPSKHQ